MRQLWLLLGCMCTIFWDTGWSQNGRQYRPGTTTQKLPSREIPGQGLIVGKEIPSFRAKAVAYLGIPYAQPPLKNLRFLPPKTPPPSWSESRNVNKSPPACMQLVDQLKEQERILLKYFPDITYNEDCLYLNIFVPDGPAPTEGWPVMVWFHPGNWSTGSASLWDGSALAISQKMLVVTVSYRLNIFGFFTTMDRHVPGNAGLLDQVAALDWVRNKIGVFGGNPKSIVLSGHSSGGSSVALHLLSPLSRDKFSRAIIMSAPGLITRSVKTSSQLSGLLSELVELFGCESSIKLLLECLQRQPTAHLMEHTKHLFHLFGPIVDGPYAKDNSPFLTEDPLNLIANMEFTKVPLLIGFNEMEEALKVTSSMDTQKGISWDDYNMGIAESVGLDISEVDDNNTCFREVSSNHLFDTALFYYTPRPRSNDLTVLRDRLVALLTEKNFGAGAYQLASALTQAGMPSFAYRFDYKIKTEQVLLQENGENLAPWITAPHQAELPFVWGMPYWTSLQKTVMWKTQDKSITDVMLNLWGNFVKSGNPTQQAITFRWEVFRENSTGILLVDRYPNMSDTSNVDYKAFEFWNDYYPKVYNVLLQTCNMTNNVPLHYSPGRFIYFVIFQLFHPLFWNFF